MFLFRIYVCSAAFAGAAVNVGSGVGVTVGVGVKVGIELGVEVGVSVMATAADVGFTDAFAAGAVAAVTVVCTVAGVVAEESLSPRLPIKPHNKRIMRAGNKQPDFFFALRLAICNTTFQKPYFKLGVAC